jgi:hypothetical protein
MARLYDPCQKDPGASQPMPKDTAPAVGGRSCFFRILVSW